MMNCTNSIKFSTLESIRNNEVHFVRMQRNRFELSDCSNFVHVREQTSTLNLPAPSWAVHLAENYGNNNFAWYALSLSPCVVPYLS